MLSASIISGLAFLAASAAAAPAAASSSPSGAAGCSVFYAQASSGPYAGSWFKTPSSTQAQEITFLTTSVAEAARYSVHDGGRIGPALRANQSWGVLDNNQRSSPLQQPYNSDVPPPPGSSPSTTRFQWLYCTLAGPDTSSSGAITCQSQGGRTEWQTFPANQWNNASVQFGWAANASSPAIFPRMDVVAVPAC